MLVALLAIAIIPVPLQVQTGAYLDTRRPVFDETDVSARIERMRRFQRDAERRAADPSRQPAEAISVSTRQTGRSHGNRPGEQD